MSSLGMISRKQWAVLLLVYILYLFVGAVVFLYAERDHEIQNLKELHKQQRRLTIASSFISDDALRTEITESIQRLESQLGKNLLLSNSFQNLIVDHVVELQEETDWVLSNRTAMEFLFQATNYTAVDLNEEGEGLEEGANGTVGFLKKFREVFDNYFSEVEDTKVEEEAMWTLWNSFFFSFTAITTIGFGHMAPRTPSGQIFCLFFSIVGVPFNGILFAGLADLFASKFIKKIDAKRYEDELWIVADALLYLLPGLGVFFVLPALVFAYVESWTYTSSVYYTFITLSTIGFGDMVSGYVDLATGWLCVYRLFIQLWITFGLGYLLMIITFIQRALRSKQLRVIDRKMKKLLKRKNKPSALIAKDLDKLGSILKILSNVRKREKMYINKEDVGGKFLHGPKGRRTLTEEVNPGYEDEDGKVVLITNSAKKEHKKVPETEEADTVDMFLYLAKTVLSEKENAASEIESEGASSEDNNTTTSTDVKKEHPVKNEAPEKDQLESKDPKDKKDGREHKKRSLSERLSSWTANTFPQNIGKSTESASSATNSPSEAGTDQKQGDKEPIADLGDLIDKVQQLLSQDVDKLNEVEYKLAKKRSNSLDGRGRVRHDQIQSLDSVDSSYSPKSSQRRILK